ncbi:MAG: L,D-transpeptidase family protein [Novosphingobium sp.]
MAAHDLAQGQALPPEMVDNVPRPLMQAQVVLDRLGFTPGVVDGKPGLSTRNALLGFQEANGLPLSGELDAATQQALARWSNIPATRVVTIPADFAAGPFVALPKDAAQQAKLPALGYESLDEKLAERFHTTVATLQMLNDVLPLASAPAGSPSNASAAPTSGSSFQADRKIRVPNVGADQIDAGSVSDPTWLPTLQTLGIGSQQAKAASIVVSKSKGTLKVYDSGDKLIGLYTATMGSEHDPLPLGNWKINGVSHNPKFHYNPKLFWDVSDSSSKQLLPPGPNGPVGVVWIDLNKPHYGIHGTPNPETIGRAQSHGCVRLTNWDAARLAQMVSPGTKVRFEA